MTSLSTALRAATPVNRRGGGWVADVRRFLADVLNIHEDREADLLQRALDGGTPAED